MDHRDIFKVITLGDASVGKTSLVYRYCEGRYNQRVTVGVDIQERTVTVLNDRVVLQFWDTAGEERYKHTIVSNYYRRVDAVVFVYDVTRHRTLDSIESWMRELENHDLDDKPKILIGNKSDCANEGNAVPIRTAQKLAAKYDMQLFTTSALLDSENDNVEALFMTLARKVHSERERMKAQSQTTKSTDNIKLNSEKQRVEVKSSCNCQGSAPADLIQPKCL